MILGPDKKHLLKNILILIVACAVILAASWLIGVPLIRLAKDPDAFRTYISSRGIAGKLIFCGMVILQVIFAVIPGEPFELAAGYAFGALEGTVLVLLSASAGSMLIFFLVRRFGSKIVQIWFSEEELSKVRFLQSSPKRDILFLIIFMLPGTPKDLLSYFAGLTDIPVIVWVFICSFGRIPSVITSTLGGNAIWTGNYGSAVLIFICTAVLSGAGLCFYKMITNKHGSSH